ncbi:MAG: hypothetical protein PW734_02610 [Verrucomicrobium sp.]|nr:hypothetical protein [Verrucomicrobium sp.]
MDWLDWAFVVLPLLTVAAVGLYARRYVRSVADFMSASRSAGRYLLCVAGGELQAGAIVFVAAFELFFQSGFAFNWWLAASVPIGILLKISGFVTYRYRETRAMTLAQFFEIRYNKSFRLFTGLIAFLAGILNFGIGPAIGARILTYFLGIPQHLHVFSLSIPSYIPLMALFLGITLFISLSGGVVTVMVINTLEGIFSQIFYLVIIFTLFSLFSWHQMHDVLLNQPPRHSLVNPFDGFGVKDFNIWYFFMALFLAVYGTMAWQNSGAYNGAALTPHEGRMGNVLTAWREMGKAAVIALLALCALTYLNHPDFAAGAAQVHERADQIANPQTRKQMAAPLAMAQFLPAGVKGIFCAILLMGIFGGDATHLHSWGSIFVQDLIVPLRRKPFGPKAHLLVLRCSILGVAAFAFFFGCFFHLADYVNMWWSVTQAIFVGGAGAAIIGGLYWRKGTAAGAWCAFVVGSALSFGGIVCQQVAAAHGHHFFLNGIQIAFFSSLIAIGCYVGVSLLTCRQDFNLERMLHRGPYAALKPELGEAPTPRRKESHLGKLIGMDENFTRGDRWIAGGLFSWSLFWFTVFVVGTVWNVVAPWRNETWAAYYHVVGLGLPVFFACVTGVWFTWGGLRDMRALFRHLKAEHVNPLDDGTVHAHRNLDEAALKKKDA